LLLQDRTGQQAAGASAIRSTARAHHTDAGSHDRQTQRLNIERDQALTEAGKPGGAGLVKASAA
jgi:hypothetical protein